jgi:hypothetical protein
VSRDEVFTLGAGAGHDPHRARIASTPSSGLAPDATGIVRATSVDTVGPVAPERFARIMHAKSAHTARGS